MSCLSCNNCISCLLVLPWLNISSMSLGSTINWHSMQHSILNWRHLAELTWNASSFLSSFGMQYVYKMHSFVQSIITCNRHAWELVHHVCLGLIYSLHNNVQFSPKSIGTQWHSLWEQLARGYPLGGLPKGHLWEHSSAPRGAPQRRPYCVLDAL